MPGKSSTELTVALNIKYSPKETSAEDKGEYKGV